MASGSGCRVKRTRRDGNTAYDALIAGRMLAKVLREKRRKPDAAGTIGWFIEKYLAADHFIGHDGRQPKFSPGTQLNYRPVLESIRSTLGPARLADLTPDNVDVYLAKIERALAGRGDAS